uniref:Uncharacterized protein n=1 Tax=Picea glauca TaxID=3330 RepID=A0A101LZN8_PICGL|nr:hypothetical protein ABT39_MTgene5297 [Picea glauca]QHR88873.1 hypothetical protein Q903MT_gene2892 [Picea sitchensis]
MEMDSMLMWKCKWISISIRISIWDVDCLLLYTCTPGLGQPGLDERDEGNPVATMRERTYAMALLLLQFNERYGNIVPTCIRSPNHTEREFLQPLTLTDTEPEFLQRHIERIQGA